MDVIGGQRRMLAELTGKLRPHWRRDAALPARIERLLRRDRRIGARDRRLYRELIYTVLRHLPWIEPLLDKEPARAEKAIAWLAAETPDTRAFRSAIAEDWPLASTLAEKAAVVAGDHPPSLLPSWLAGECPEAFAGPNYEALNRRAPLWLRLQTDDPARVFAEFGDRGWTWRQSEWLANAVSLAELADVTATEVYRAGRVEVQDLGSQMILEAVGIEPGGRWLDACAGAGGKSLQLAAILGAKGRVEANDIRAEALQELGRRSARAGLAGRIAQPAGLSGLYDGVLVDAPCSGSGTWRRSPHLKWVTTKARVEGCARLQWDLIRRFSAFVRPGGRLVYATCSLCRSENDEIVAKFLAANPHFAPAPWAQTFAGEPRGHGLAFWPAAHDGDGFYAASLRRLA